MSLPTTYREYVEQLYPPKKRRSWTAPAAVAWFILAMLTISALR